MAAKQSGDDDSLPMHLVDDSIGPPPPWKVALEVRAFFETGAALVGSPLLKRLPQGDGHSVLVIPGIGQDDGSTILLRRALRQLGYDARGWGQGRNGGTGHLSPGLRVRLRQIADESGQPLSLIGWSWGGIFARELAKEFPESARCVVTLGSPFTGNPTANSLTWLYRLMNGRPAAVRRRWFELREPPPVPNTSIYSRTDGVVAWRCSLNEPGAQNENVGIISSHLGMGQNPFALQVIADRLSQPGDRWRPYQPPPALRRLFTVSDPV